jgi:hypothetical protein
MRIRIQQLKLMRIQIRNTDNGKISFSFLDVPPFPPFLYSKSFFKSTFHQYSNDYFYVHVQMANDETTFTDESIRFHDRQYL